MKGMIFTEFLEMVESKFGEDMADDIIEDKPLESGGAYTAVGTYDYSELVQLIVNLSERTEVPIPDLIKAFGSYAFSRFTVAYAYFFTDVANLFDFMQNLHGYIHVEVHKLYPEAELPYIDCQFLAPNQLQVDYQSERPFADFAEGLMTGAIEYFAEPITLKRKEGPDLNSHKASFVLTKAITS